ncbi:MAG: TetR/AcrR family transcriptional regulator [Acidobacteria bacterium]|nr:TetR/AcrR family transcriptional regulator [Acidobacteriota bacterium]
MQSSLSPSKRQPRLPSAERRRLIVDAAIKLFAEKGFRGVTTRELAAQVGVSEPVLYMHFHTKRDLYSAIIETIAATPPQSDSDPQPSGQDDRAYFLKLARHLLEWHTGDPCRPRLLLHSALEGHELASLFFTRQIAPFFDTLAAHIQSRIDAGAFRPTDPLSAARAFCGMIGQYAQGLVIFKLPDSQEKQKETLEQMIDLFLSGIFTPQSKSK